MLIVLLAVFNDGAMIALSKDRVVASPMPNTWNLKAIFISGIVYGLYLTVSSWALFFTASKTQVSQQLSSCCMQCHNPWFELPSRLQLVGFASCSVLELTMVCLRVQFFRDKCHMFSLNTRSREVDRFCRSMIGQLGATRGFDVGTFVCEVWHCWSACCTGKRK